MFLVGQFRKQTADGAIWDFQGVFATRDSAIAACRNRNYFFKPVRLDEELPDEMIPGEVIYPLA
ncbi:MAG TPA: hypothetical protein VGM17_02325 [Rhizomicrobium sp.]|jgi:hypothetical protein